MKLAELATILLFAPLAAFAASPPATGLTETQLTAQLAPKDQTLLLLAPVATEKLLAEDALLEGKVGLPLRYGIVQTVAPTALDASKSSAGVWTTLTDGRLQWRLEVEAKEATSLEFAFSEFRLPHGAQLWLRSLDHKQVIGPLTDADNSASGRYYSPMLEGSHALIELTLPAAKRPTLALALDRVVHGYRDPFAAPSQQKSGSCNIDTICPQGDAWRNQIASVAHYSFQSDGSSFVCTGSLVATGHAAQDRASPRLTTANHCVSTNAVAQTMVFYWGYESPTCRSPGSAASGTPVSRNSNTRATQSGATLLATHAPTDFTTVQLSSRVPAEALAYFSGWDRSNTVPTGSVGIHHPQGHEKRITFNSDPLLTEANCSTSAGRVPGNTHWLITQYESGTTEGGSSGSGLWNPGNQLLVGVLSGGSALCTVPDGYDCYGKLSVAWDGSGSEVTRMRDWLDRRGTNPQTVPGLVAACAAPSVSLNSTAFTTPPAASQPVQFTGSASGGSGGFTYHWDVDGDGVFDRSGSATSITVSYPKAGPRQVRLLVEDSTGCGAEVSRALDVQGPALTATAGAEQQVCGDNDAAIEPGERWRVPVTLRNGGTVALPTGARALFTPGAASSGVLPIGPNAFGYRAATTATGGCGFEFVDIANGANAVAALPTSVANGNTFGPLDDARTTATIALGGTGFRLYGQAQTQAVMSTNGYISFSTVESGGDHSNDCDGVYNNGAAGPQLRAHHDDLVVSTQTGAGLRYRYFASCPRQAESDRNQAQGCHVFQWSRMQIYNNAGAATGDFEFQAIAYERTGQVSYQYRTASPDAGASSTIGISNTTGNDPLNVGCNAANAATASSAICVFEPSALPVVNAGLRIESPAPALPTLASAAQTTVNVTIAIKTDATCGAPLSVDYFGTAVPGSFSLDRRTVLSTTIGGGGTCQVSSNCPAQVTNIAPRPGLYSNPQRPGNGIAHFVYGSVYGSAWYTALSDRTPTWYTLTGDYADNLASAPIERFFNASAPSGFNPQHANAGRAWTAQLDPDSVLYAWALSDGNAGMELMDAFPLPFSNPNHSQVWYTTAESGWGLAIESLNTGGSNALEFIGAYVYDSNGIARWMIGDSTSLSGGTVPLTLHRPHCAGCPWFADWESQRASAGSLSRTYTGPTSATLGTSIALPAPLAGSWTRSGVNIITIGAPAPPGQ